MKFLKFLTSNTKAATQPLEKKGFSNLGRLSTLIAADDLTAYNSYGALKLYERSSAVAIVINAISRQVSQIKPIIMRDGNVDEGTDILDRLYYPSPDWTMSQLLESISVNLSAAGVAYIWAAGNVNRPAIELAPVNSDIVNIFNEGNDVVLSYEVNDGPYRGMFTRTEEVMNGRRVVRYLNGNFAELIVIRSFDPRSSSGQLPFSPLRPIQDEINQLLHANRHNLNLLKNGGTLSLLFTLSHELGEEEFAEADNLLHEKYAGTNKAGAMAVTRAGEMDIKELGLSPKDMNWEEMQRTAIQRVAQQFSYPPLLVTTDDATFNNMAESKEMAWDNAVFPMVRIILESLETFFGIRHGLRDAEFDLWFDETAIPALRRRRAEEVKLLNETGALTLNEKRKILGRESYGDAGDVVYIAGTMVPIGEPMFEDEPERDIVKPSDDG